MKVLFVQNIEGIAGSEKYFWQLLPALKMEGVDVSFLCVYKKEYNQISTTFCDYLIQKDIPVYRIETKSYLSLGLLREMKNMINHHRFDIIHSHLIYADFWSAALRTFFGVKTKTVSTLHGYQEHIYTKFCLNPDRVPKNNYYFVARFTYKRIDHIYSCSQGLKNFFLGVGIQFKNEVKVIYHGFDYPIIEPELKNNASEFRCAIPGRLIPRKGHQLVLKNCKMLSEKIAGFKLDIIGDGELRSELENYVLENDLKEYVVFKGNVGDVRPHLVLADLILVPSYAEGLPLVIFEAMSVSKPVIAFDTIGPAEVIENTKNGYLIKSFDADKFAEKIIELSHNEHQLREMGQQAKKYVLENHSLNSMVKKTMEFYDFVLKH